MNSPTPAPQTSTAKSSNWGKMLLFLVVLVALFILARALDLGQRLEDLQGWVAGFGTWGPAVFVLLYAVATVAMVPGTALTFLAGPLFGPLVGTVAVSLGSTLGATLAFLVSRYVARRPMEAWLADQPRFAKLDRLSERHGDLIVAITRLVPLFPFNLLNYGLGLTRVRLGSYVFWSWLCMLPATILYVVGVSAVTQALAEGRVPWALLGVVAAVGLMLALLIKNARARLRAGEERP